MSVVCSSRHSRRTDSTRIQWMPSTSSAGHTSETSYWWVFTMLLVIMHTTINHREIITLIDYVYKSFKFHWVVVSISSQKIKQSVRPPQCDKEQVWGEATFHLIQGYFGPMCGGRPFNLEIWSPSTIIFLKVSRWHCCPPLDIIGGGPSSLVLYAGGGKKFLWDCKKP